MEVDDYFPFLSRISSWCEYYFLRWRKNKKNVVHTSQSYSELGSECWGYDDNLNYLLIIRTVCCVYIREHRLDFKTSQYGLGNITFNVVGDDGGIVMK